ncbi:hypothetical protein QQS21_012471 [Conoideocrella luteorostrata]|uniref:Beta-glucuronidase C-terminal domain-containing protein n=1 Tax=Conoideocrella luteorostrata TaxID=1105319 RepID=A0AAJ0CDZ1_9HYPO|nr:hypothetical protein QQS21_012471 [Conoideocrella luteorostrata]
MACILGYARDAIICAFREKRLIRRTRIIRKAEFVQSELDQGYRGSYGRGTCPFASDYSKYDGNQKEPVTPPQNGAGIGQKFTWGPTFFEGFKNFPGTRFVYDIPFAKLNRSNSLAQAKEALHSIGMENLEALEIGNEPDLYVRQGVRSKPYGPAEYSAEWKAYSDWLVASLGLPNKPLFQALTFAGATDGQGDRAWTPHNALDAGMASGGRIKTVSIHHYQRTNSTAGLQCKSENELRRNPVFMFQKLTGSATFMNHTALVSSLSAHKRNFMWMQTNHLKMGRVLGESGRYTTSGSSIDNSEGIWAGALWTADYLMYTMTLNVSRVHMQLGQVFGYAAWHPVTIGDISPQVRSPYYGHLFAADFIGKSNAFRVKELDTGDDLSAVYAGYDAGVLNKMAIINFDVWRGDGSRPTRSFKIQIPAGVKSVQVRTLTSAGGATTSGSFSWAGQTWTHQNNGVASPEHPSSVSIKAVDGFVNIAVGASEAALILL